MNESGESSSSLRAEAEHQMQMGNFGRADALYARLVAREGADGRDWFNYGFVLRCNRKFADAVYAYERALLTGVARPEEASLNLAAILAEHLGDWTRARSVLVTALAATPGFVAGWLNLGQLFEDSGSIVDASSAYRSALDVAPDNGRALGRLAALANPNEDNSALASRLSELIDHPSTTLANVAEAGFGLGHLLDANGRYDEAFAAFLTANEAVLEGREDHFAYHPAAAQRLIDRLIAADFDAHRSNRNGDISPVFICGMFRSGSTLAEHLVSRHRSITAGGELESIPALAAEISDYPEGLSQMDRGIAQDMADRYLQEVCAHLPDAKIFTDKRPDNFLHIGLIKTLFPAAKIIHTRRNFLDTMLSIYFGNFDSSLSYAFDLDDIADWWGQYSRLMGHWHRVYPEDIFDLDYDLLVKDPEAELRAAIAFLGLDWEDDILVSTEPPGFVRTLSAWQVRQPLHGRSSGRARHYARQLHRFSSQRG